MMKVFAAEGKYTTVTGRVLRAGCGLCAAVLLLSAGCVNISSESGPVFHRDPSTVREHFAAWLLFAQLGNALQSVASEQFGSSDGQLATVTVDGANLPSGLVDLARRYVDLCNELADTIQRLYDTLQQVGDLLAANDVQRAGPALETGRALITQAREQLSALDRATLEVFAVLQRSGSGGSTAELAQARQSLDAAIARLSQLAAEYESRLELAQSVADDERVLAQPTVTLLLDRDAAWVGETVLLSGTAMADGGPLADRELLVLMDGLEVARIRSGDSGQFSYGLPVPFEYVPLRVVQVSYLPAGGDLDHYRGASSGEAALTVRFHQSQVTLEPFGSLHPGLVTALSGAVVSSGNVGARLVEAWWGDEAVGEATTDPSGAFRCNVTLPEDAQEGESVLQLSVAGDDSALTAPGVVEADVDVVRASPRVDISVGRLLLVPSPSVSLLRQLLGGDFVRMVPVSGSVNCALPMELPAMTAYWGERQIRWQQQGTVIEREAPLVISVWSMGVRTVTVRATPQEPWLKPGEATARLLVVNLFVPFVWLTALLAALGLGSVVRRRRASARPPGIAGPLVVEAGGTRPSIAGVHRTTDDAYVGPRLALVATYYRAVEFLHTTLGLTLRSEMTLREYLAAATRRLPAGTRLFAKLTSLTELALYGPREPERRDVALGRRLLSALRWTGRPDTPDDKEHTL